MTNKIIIPPNNIKAKKLLDDLANEKEAMRLKIEKKLVDKKLLKRN